MKSFKKLLLGLLFSLVLIGTGCGKEIFHTIDYKELANKFKANETFVIYLGSSECSHCKLYRPTLEKVVDKYNLDVYYIDMAKITENQYKEITNKTRLEGTPSVMYVKNGSVETTRLVGEKTEQETIDYFKGIGMIKEQNADNKSE